MWRISLTGVLLVVGVGCSQSATVILETPPDVAAVGGSVRTLSGSAVAGATLRIKAFGVLAGRGTQLIDTFSAQTDSEGHFAQVLILGPFGLQQCQLHITVTPPVGSGLTVKADSVMARVNAMLPPADTAKLNFVLTP